MTGRGRGEGTGQKGEAGERRKGRTERVVETENGTTKEGRGGRKGESEAYERG